MRERSLPYKHLLMLGAMALCAPVAAQMAPAQQTATTRHTIQLHGKALSYQATAATLPIRTRDGAQGTLFYVAYTRPDMPPAGRPVLFLFNGGPGSASLWLNIGAFGPRRVETNSPAATPAWPIRMVDNQETLLDVADLVVIDAVGTGYSRVAPGTAATAFDGVDPDLASFTAFVTTWLTQNNRWASPRFVLGESYGATRAAALAHQLQRAGAAPSGMILISSILNFSAYHPGIDRGFVNALPSIAATAWYHHRAGQDAPDLPTFVQQARDFAEGPYADALLMGSRLPPAQQAQVMQGLERFTGLSPAVLARTGLRLDRGQFAHLLLGDGRMVGIYDSRATAQDTDPAAQSPSFDAAETVVGALFPPANAQYLADELNYHTTEPYRATVGGLDHRWDWSHQSPAHEERVTSPAMEDDLSVAMHEDPTMRVLSLNGYYDLGTPVLGTEHDLARMMLTPELKRNLVLRHYAAGHMVYLDATARAQAAQDIRSMIQQPRGGAR